MGRPLNRGADRRQRTGRISHWASGALYHQAIPPERGQKILAAMQDGVLNLCRVKLRDQRARATGVMKEYPAVTHQTASSAAAVCRVGQMRRAAATAGNHLKAKGKTDPTPICISSRSASMEDDLQCDRQGGRSRSELRHAEAHGCRTSRKYSQHTNSGRSRKQNSRRWTSSTNTHPVRPPSFSMEGIGCRASLRATGTIVEVTTRNGGQIPDLGNPNFKRSEQPHRGHALAPARRTHR